jgi:hypothetical protein
VEGASAFVPQTLSTEAHRYQSLPSKMKYHQRYLHLGDHVGIISWYFNVFHMFPGMDYLWLSSKTNLAEFHLPRSSGTPGHSNTCCRGLSEKLKISRWNCSQCLILVASIELTNVQSMIGTAIGCHQEHSRRRCGGWRDEGSEAGQEFDLEHMDRLWIGILWQFNKEWSEFGWNGIDINQTAIQFYPISDILLTRYMSEVGFQRNASINYHRPLGDRNHLDSYSHKSKDSLLFMCIYIYILYYIIYIY